MNIEKYLILNKYLLSLFGVNESKELFNELKDVKEGFDEDGRSYFVNVLRGFENLKILEDELLRYDQNIQSYVRKISFRREHINLKYFQYLAVLFTEIVLDNLKNKNGETKFLDKLLEEYKKNSLFTKNDLKRKKTKKKKEDEEKKNEFKFTQNDLKKLAFWMATGSGKTLIMHINYYQFLNYRLFSPDNIILITPNEGLSKQHFEELQKSGIPCSLYSGNLNGGFGHDNEVLVIEITKIVEEKKGGGVTLPVEVFEGRNLVFVDEGHKGKRSEEQKWTRLRNRLSENGFVFEYSATFGQILSESNPEILQEYAKSIVFDYSYKYFYLDGYGKDFSILNIENIKNFGQEFQEIMFVANLLSFYEQILVYEDKITLAKEHNLEKPLWIFVGTTVSGKEVESDVIQIVEFLKRVIHDEDWLEKRVGNILQGEIKVKDDGDLFEDKFKYLRTEMKTINYEDLYRRVFGGKGSLRLYELRNAGGELGLKVGENEYFGVISIGDVSGFKKQLEKKGILVEQDTISSSLFYDIKKEDSKINILIGSKKFIEGWDTWRVSSMGLLNIGAGHGPQIIQLFGRGVRLKGKGLTLKRSCDSSIKILETLNVYGIKADYLKQFLHAIRSEEVEFETIEIPVKLQHKEKWNTLYTPLAKQEEKFEEKEILRLEIDTHLSYTVDLLPSVSIYQAKNDREEINREYIKPEGEKIRFQKNMLDLLDWQRIWLEMIEFKAQRGYWNLIFDREVLENILLSERYSLLLPEKIDVEHEEDIKKLEDIALMVIKKYLDLFYRKKAKHFETENLSYGEVKQLPLPFISEKKQGYIVQIDKKNQLVKEIRELVKNLEELYEDTDRKTSLPRLYFDKSLYVPILLQSEKIDKITPAGLVESEKEFVEGLKRFLNQDELEFEVYILRNHPFTGVGFQLQWSKFYPDFIMWVKKADQQTIVFIDPKGLEHTKGLDDEKIMFCNDIKEIEKKIRRKDSSSSPTIVLESFILSYTAYSDIIRGMQSPPKENEYNNKHVLFLKDKDWPNKLFQLLDIIK